MGKFVSVAAQRIAFVDERGDGVVSVGLKGVAGEKVVFAFDVKGKMQTQTATIGGHGTATITSVLAVAALAGAGGPPKCVSNPTCEKGGTGPHDREPDCRNCTDPAAS